MKFRFPFLLVLSCLASCESKEAPIRHESIVVYASYSDESYLPELFAEFTDETGIPVTVTYDGSDVLTRNLIFNIGSPPADVFLSRSVADLWRAADEGALRPIAAANLEQVPEALRDLDGLWTAVNYQQSVIAYRGDLDEPLPRGLVDLGDEKYRGRLCVSSAALPANRLIVSGWTAGTFLQSQADLAIRAIHPQPAYTQIEGIGVARHSRYPDSAQQLVNWMLSKTVNQQHARNVNAIPAIGTPLAPEVGQAPAVAGWNNEEARSLAERAGYR